MSEIVFTDRYGGNPPSLIVGCYECEAMGCYPQPPDGARNADGTIAIDHPDEWEFVRCAACDGTGRVPLWRGLLRLPRLWAKGARFLWRTRAYYGSRRPTAAEWWLSFKIAFLYDLFRLHRKTARWAR